MLNIGCGKTHLPSEMPPGHEMVDVDIYNRPLWINIDKVDGVGADIRFDIFKYPWPLPSNSFDGALLAHIVEHVNHEIRVVEPHWPSVFDENFQSAFRQWRSDTIKWGQLQDGWYAFFSELYRVLTPGALVHIVSPYGHGDGAITDPTHTRYLTVNTFQHSMQPDSDGATFQYNNGGINFRISGAVTYRSTEMVPMLEEKLGMDYQTLLMLFNNVCYDFYLRLEAVK